MRRVGPAHIGARGWPNRFSLVLAGRWIGASSQKDMEQKRCWNHVSIIALSGASHLRPNELTVECLAKT